MEGAEGEGRGLESADWKGRGREVTGGEGGREKLKEQPVLAEEVLDAAVESAC